LLLGEALEELSLGALSLGLEGRLQPAAFGRVARLERHDRAAVRLLQ
jgi:hypothetical protein